MTSLTSLKQQGQQLLPEASQAKQTEFQSRLEVKTSALLQNAIDTDLVSLNQNLNVTQINQRLTALKQDYGSFSRYSQVEKGKQKLISQKEKLVKAQIKTIEGQIAQADNTSFQRLENLPQQSSQYQKLNSLFASRKKQLAEQQRLAQQQKKLDGSKKRIAFLEANGNDEGAMQFKTLGLNNAAFFDYIYRGHFENI